MEPLRSEDLRGNWATPLLPYDADENIDYGRLGAQVDTLIEAKVSGIYTNGTTAEFYNQTEEEFDRISLLAADRCNGAGIPFQLGVSHMSPQVSLERLRRVVSLEPSAVQVILPDWHPVSEAEAIAFLQRMAETAAPVGLVLYNPPHAKWALDPEEFGRLREAVPSLVGLKVADGDRDWYERMREHTQGLALFVPGHHLATGIQRGAHGAYSNVACLSPRGAQRWYEQMSADLPKALELEERIRAFIEEHILPFILEGEYSNPAVDRLLALIGNWADVGERMRWPYQWIPATEAERLRPIAQETLPEMFA